MIIPIKNPDMVSQIIPLIAKVKHLPYDRDGYYKYILDRLPLDECVLFADINDSGVIKSFVFLEVVVSITDREAFIDLAYFDPHSQTVGDEMADLIMKWGRMNNCSRASALVDEKKDGAFIKKYGFETRFVYVSKDITEVAK